MVVGKSSGEVEGGCATGGPAGSKAQTWVCLGICPRSGWAGELCRSPGLIAGLPPALCVPPCVCLCACVSHANHSSGERLWSKAQEPSAGEAPPSKSSGSHAPVRSQHHPLGSWSSVSAWPGTVVPPLAHGGEEGAPGMCSLCLPEAGAVQAHALMNIRGKRPPPL